jgi:hypothetical protein
MSNKATVHFRTDVGVEDSYQGTTQELHGNQVMEMKVTGTLRRRAFSLDVDADLSVPANVFYIRGGVWGYPVLVLRNKTVSARRIAIHEEGFVHYSTDIIRLNGRVVIDEDAESFTYLMAPGLIRNSVLVNQPTEGAKTREERLKYALITSARWITSKDAQLFLLGGGWDVHLVEFENDTSMRVDVGRD